MKHLSLLSILVGLSVSARAQEVIIDTNYYAPPPVVRRPVLTADPNHNPRYRSAKPGQRSTQRPFSEQLNEVQSWYVSAEGGFRSDVSTLTNSIDGLVSNPAPIKAVWSVLLGYTYRNAWTIEAGYTQAPVHLNITIANNDNPLVYLYQNSGYGIPLRVKRRIGSGRRAANGTGFWLTGGGWLVPNGTGQTGDFRLIGYSHRGRNRADTLRLNNSATVLNRVTGIAEFGIDYTTRLSPYIELGFFVRTYWGLGNALRSDLIYTVNHSSTQQATLTANGTGWGFGVALRYVYGRQHELKKASASF